MPFRAVGSLAGWCGVVLCLASSSLVAASPAGAVAGFGDVAEGRYYTEPVQWSVDNDVADIDGNCFLPDAPVSRGEAAVYIWNMRGQPSAPAHSFVDVTDESQDAAVSWMSHNEVTTGTSPTTFDPGGELTRAHLVTFLWRLAGKPSAPDHPFVDVHASWQQGSVSWASDREITTGTSPTTFSPDSPLTRAHLVTFLYRYRGKPDVTVDPASPECDPDAEPAALPPVVVPGDGTAVSVPRGGSFTAELEEVSVDAPVGALSGEAQVSLSTTSVGTGEVPDGEELATAPLALRVTGAEIVKPLTLRFGVDTSSLTPAGVVPAWYSSELGSWVPLDAQSVVIGDGVVTVTANLADTRPVSAVTALGPALVYAGVDPLNGGGDAAGPALAVPLLVVGGYVLLGLVVGAGVLVVLNSDVVHDALKEFFGLVAREPVCPGGLPAWVDSLSDSEDSLSGGRARLFTCGQSAGDDLLVKVVNNRNYGIEFNAASGRTPVELAGGSLPESALDLLIKQTAEEVIGGSYLWPLSSSEFRLREQSRDWSGNWRPTGTTAVVDGVRVGIDLLKIAVPGLSLAESDQQKLLVCFSNLLKQGVKIGKGSFHIWNFEHWRAVLTDVAGCFIASGGDNSEQAKMVREGLKEVNKVLGQVSTASSAAKWALTAADATKDNRRDEARIRVSVPDDDQANSATETPGDTTPGDTTSDDTTPPPTPIAKAVSAGFWHTCAIRTDDTITCWGNNWGGQTDAPSGTFKAVSAGGYYWCAIRTDDTITCRGRNSFGQADAPSGTFKTVSAGGGNTCAVRTDDTITCWGYKWNNDDAPSGTFKAVSAGNRLSCAVRTDDTITCWGSNYFGQADAPSGTFKTVSAGTHHSCAVRTDDTITCWGDKSRERTDAPSGTFNTVSAGDKHSCAVRTDGTITCWGNNWYGETDAPSGTFKTVSAGFEHSCGLRSYGTITCWGSN